uniref:MACPF domain-containing protein n=1 Tax=Callorhinchus milii TaxID=7868 RepID=A0A4W3GKQ1_CALMI
SGPRWLLLRLLLPALPALLRADCNTGTANQCQAARAVPGHNLGGEGFDVVTLTRKGAYVIDTESWRQPDGTCTLCRNPLADGALQRLPLSLTDWRAAARCSRAVSARSFESDAQLAQDTERSLERGWETGLEVKPKPGMAGSATVAGSQSRSSRFAAGKTQRDRYSFTSHEFSCGLYRYRLAPEARLAPSFAYSVKVLPKSLTRANRFFYRRFLG